MNRYLIIVTVWGTDRYKLDEGEDPEARYAEALDEEGYDYYETTGIYVEVQDQDIVAYEVFVTDLEEMVSE